MSQSREKSHQPLRKKRTSGKDSSMHAPGKLFRFTEMTGDTHFAQTLANYSRPAPYIQAKFENRPPSTKKAPSESQHAPLHTPHNSRPSQSRIQRILDFQPHYSESDDSQSIMPSANGELSSPAGLESQLNSRTGLGEPLSPETKSSMESGFGADFSSVRLHRDTQADSMSRSINAKAFTYGQDIYFKSGEYSTGDSGGQRLLAHELTHTLQQSPGGVLQQKRIQMIPEETRNNSAIDYPTASESNLNWWRHKIRSFRPFRHLQIAPGSHPNAYANHTFTFQQHLRTIRLDGITVAQANGVWGNITLQAAFAVAERLSAGGEDAARIRGSGIDMEILERFQSLATQERENPESFVSAWFQNHEQFNLVNTLTFYSIRRGDQGEFVEILQQGLMELNYALPMERDDGRYGDETEAAIRSFQADMGFTGREIDGVVGYNTLRALDIRLARIPFSRGVRSAGEPGYRFRIPVTEYMTQEAFTRLALQTMFHIGPDEATVLIGEGWHISNYREIDDRMIRVGSKTVTIRRSLFEQIMGSRDRSRSRGGSEESRDRLTELRTLNSSTLQGRGRIREINERISAINTRVMLLSVSPHPGMDIPISDYNQEQISRLLEESRELEEEKRRLFARWGISAEEFTQDEERFKRLFTGYAAQVALRMLDDNSARVGVEAQRLNGDTGVPDIQTALRDLDQRWDDADREYWRGVSLEVTTDHPDFTPDEERIKNASDLREVANQGHPTHPQAPSRAQQYEMRFRYLKPESAGQNVSTFPNDHFRLGIEGERAATARLGELAQRNPILAFPGLELRNRRKTLLGMDDNALQTYLLRVLDNPDHDNNDQGPGIRQAIAETRRRISSDPNLVYSMPPVLARARQDLGILSNTYQALLVNDAKEEFEDARFWRDMGLAALGITLGLLALVSGPIGWAALAGGLVVGGIDAYIQYQEITTARDAADSAMDPAQALSNTRPSYFWFYFSLATMGLDVFQGIQMVRSVMRAAAATRAGVELAEELSTALVRERRVLQEALEAAGDNVDEVARITRELERVRGAIAALDPQEFARNIDVLRHLAESPHAVLSMARALQEDDIARAFGTLQEMIRAGNMTEEAYQGVVRFYAGVGREYISELPEVMDLVRAGNLQRNGAFFNELMQNPGMQRALLDHDNDPELLLRLWREWTGARTGTFVEFLGRRGIETSLERGTRLADEFGAGFAQLEPLVRNRMLLRRSHPRLLDALNSGELSENTARALRELLGRDLIGGATDLGRATIRVSRELPAALAPHLDSMSELTRVLRMIDDPGIRRTLFEAASHIRGHDEFAEMLARFSDDISEAAARSGDDVYDDLMRIGPVTDEGTLRRLIANDALRDALANFPDAARALKRCASPCFPRGMTPEQIERLGQLLNRSGLSDEQLRQLNQLLYASRREFEDLGLNGEALVRRWDELLGSLPENGWQVLRGVDLPDISLPRAWRALLEGPDAVDVQRFLAEIANSSLPRSQVDRILRSAAGAGVDGRVLIEQLASLGRQASAIDPPLQRLGRFLDALETYPRTLQPLLNVIMDPGKFRWIDELLEVVSPQILANEARLLTLLPDALPIAALKNLFRVVDANALTKLTQLAELNAGMRSTLRHVIQHSPPEKLSQFLVRSDIADLTTLLGHNHLKRRIMAILRAADTSLADFDAAIINRLFIDKVGRNHWDDLIASIPDFRHLSLLEGLYDDLANYVGGNAQFYRALDWIHGNGNPARLQELIGIATSRGNSARDVSGLLSIATRQMEGGAADNLAHYLELTRRFSNSTPPGSRYEQVTNAAARALGIDDFHLHHFVERHSYEFFDFDHWIELGRNPSTFLPRNLRGNVLDIFRAAVDDALTEVAAQVAAGTFRVTDNSRTIVRISIQGQDLDFRIGFRAAAGDPTRFRVNQFYPRPQAGTQSIESNVLSALERFLN